ncbi:rod-determining factor RdfA [Haloferax gibbonsii]|uniref:rod-determining factor RdfA n=1 Tax=Haloferax gibbonsii TaxID=35746 RepID=UPI0009E211CA|nr:rod-determining factor RdfA [Haloferax gibbonsii]
MSTNQGNSRRKSKIERVIENYGLDGFGDTLARRWTDPKDGDSLRDLADLMNQEVLNAVLRDADADVLNGEVENMYGLLTDDDTTEGMRVQAKNTLQSKGIDVDQLLTDFVSHQAVYTYLTDIRGVSKESKSTNRVDSVVQSIQKLRGRLVAVIERSLDSLRNTNKLQLGDFDVLVDTQVYCRDCGTQYEVIQLLKQGRCDCDTKTNSE